MSETVADQSSILFVCTGNVCRSPYMEYSLRGMLHARGVHDVVLSSAGTRALTGHGMDEQFHKRLSERRIDASGFRSTQICSEVLERAALIVTATREHRREVVRFGNAFAGRTFTLAQLARLLAENRAISRSPARQRSAGAERAKELLVAAVAADERRSLATAADDVDDPWRRSRRVHRRVADRMDELLIPLAEGLSMGS